MDGSAPNCDQLNHGLRGFLYIARWLSKSIATARESLIYLPKLDLFASSWTVTPTGRLRDLNTQAQRPSGFGTFLTIPGPPYQAPHSRPPIPGPPYQAPHSRPPIPGPPIPGPPFQAHHSRPPIPGPPFQAPPFQAPIQGQAPIIITSDVKLCSRETTTSSSGII